MDSIFWIISHFAMCLLKMAVVSSTSSFLQNRTTPGWEWKMVGYLDMTDPTQQCPDSWQSITSPRSSCGKKSNAPCDSLKITTSGASYQTVCGRFRGYQIGTPDAFTKVIYSIATSIETYYVDGVTVTYGSPGNRHHVYTYAAGFQETNILGSCPCTGVNSVPLFLGSDYYCESGNPGPGYVLTQLYSSDVLWDRQQCGGNEGTCCNPPDLPWFCKTFPNPISEDLEVRICTDESLDNENVAIESFELYIQVAIPLKAASIFNPDNTLHQLEISWVPVGRNATLYTVRVAGADSSVGQGCTVCTTSPCLYLYQVTCVAVNYNISVTPINEDGSLGSQNRATFRPMNSVFKNVSTLSYSNFIGCSFLNNQSFYCVVCCSTDPSVPPDSSVYNISTTRGTEVTVILQGLTNGQIYYCKAAATNTSSAHCAGPVVGDVKMYFNFVASTTFPTTSNMSMASIDTYTIIGITIFISFVVFFSLGVLVTMSMGYMVKKRSKETLHHAALEPSVYEMINTDQKKTATIDMEANSAYENAK